MSSPRWPVALVLAQMGARVASQSGLAAHERATVEMRSPINWALLGLVIQRASYGYELVQRFERTYGESLELSSPSQIYVALDALEKKGLIQRVLPSDSPLTRQPKLHYRVTKQGLESFQAWLVAHVEHDRTRSRLFASQLAMLPPDRALAVLDRYEQACLSEASRATPSRGHSRDGADTGALLSERLCLEDERLALEARLAWVAYARLQLSANTLASIAR